MNALGGGMACDIRKRTWWALSAVVDGLCFGHGSFGRGCTPIHRLPTRSALLTATTTRPTSRPRRVVRRQKLALLRLRRRLCHCRLATTASTRTCWAHKHPCLVAACRAGLASPLVSPRCYIECVTRLGFRPCVLVQVPVHQGREGGAGVVRACAAKLPRAVPVGHAT